MYFTIYPPLNGLSQSRLEAMVWRKRVGLAMTFI
jgi:hypothetical protein